MAKSTTFNRQEVEAVLNYATEIARDIVEFGDLGTLSPSFKSKVVPVGEVFNVQKHIEKPVVRLSPSRKCFTLTDVTYEQTTAKAVVQAVTTDFKSSFRSDCLFRYSLRANITLKL